MSISGINIFLEEVRKVKVDCDKLEQLYKALPTLMPLQARQDRAEDIVHDATKYIDKIRALESKGGKLFQTEDDLLDEIEKAIDSLEAMRQQMRYDGVEAQKILDKTKAEIIKGESQEIRGSAEERLIIRTQKKKKDPDVIYQHVHGKESTYNSDIDFERTIKPLWAATNAEINIVIQQRLTLLRNTAQEVNRITGSTTHQSTQINIWESASLDRIAEADVIMDILQQRAADIDATDPAILINTIKARIRETEGLKKEANSLLSVIRDYKKKLGNVFIFREKLDNIQASFYKQDNTRWLSLSEAEKAKIHQESKLAFIRGGGLAHVNEHIKLTNSLIRSIGSAPPNKGFSTILSSAKDFLVVLTDAQTTIKYDMEIVSKINNSIINLKKRIEQVKQSMLNATRASHWKVVISHIEKGEGYIKHIYELGIKDNELYIYEPTLRPYGGIELKTSLNKDKEFFEQSRTEALAYGATPEVEAPVASIPDQKSHIRVVIQTIDTQYDTLIAETKNPEVFKEGLDTKRFEAKKKERGDTIARLKAAIESAESLYKQLGGAPQNKSLGNKAFKKALDKKIGDASLTEAIDKVLLIKKDLANTKKFAITTTAAGAQSKDNIKSFGEISRQYNKVVANHIRITLLSESIPNQEEFLDAVTQTREDSLFEPRFRLKRLNLQITSNKFRNITGFVLDDAERDALKKQAEERVEQWKKERELSLKQDGATFIRREERARRLIDTQSKSINDLMHENSALISVLLVDINNLLAHNRGLRLEAREQSGSSMLYRQQVAKEITGLKQMLIHVKDIQQYESQRMTPLAKVDVQEVSAPAHRLPAPPIPTTIEQMSRLEGWEPHGFYGVIKAAKLKYQMQYRYISNDPPPGRKIVEVQPMQLSYEEHLYHGVIQKPLPGFYGTLIDAIRKGKRTATTRSYLINGQVGDIIKFYGPTGFAYCEITVMPYDITHIAPPVGYIEGQVATKAPIEGRFRWARYANEDEDGFECSSRGDLKATGSGYKDWSANIKMYGSKDFSDYEAKIDGHSIKQLYKEMSAEKTTELEKWNVYKALWSQWTWLHPEKFALLYEKAAGKRLTDGFATGQISAARALCELLNGKSTGGNPLYMQELEKLPSQKGVLKIDHALQTIDRQKMLAKVNMANKYIGFGEGILKDGVNASSTEHYRLQAGMLANVGVYNEKDTVFVSVPGNRGGKAIAYPNIYRTLAEVKIAVAGGATILSDDKISTAISTYNVGEQELVKLLTAMGAHYTEVIHMGALIGVWNKNKKKLGVVKNDMELTLSEQGTLGNPLFHNRQRDALAVARMHHLPGGVPIPWDGASDVEIIEKKTDTVLAVGYDRIVFGDHGPYIEMNITQVNFVQFTDKMIFKNSNAYFSEYYSKEHTKLYVQQRDVSALRNPPRGSVHSWKQNHYVAGEGYADYRPEKFYISVDDVRIRKIGADVVSTGLTIEDEVIKIVSDIGRTNNLAFSLHKQMAYFETQIFKNVVSDDVKKLKKSYSKPVFTEKVGTEKERRVAKMPNGALTILGGAMGIEKATAEVQKAIALANYIYPEMMAIFPRIEAVKSRKKSTAKEEYLERLKLPSQVLLDDKDMVGSILARLHKILPAPPADLDDVSVTIDSSEIKAMGQLINQQAAVIKAKIEEMQVAFDKGEDTTFMGTALLSLIGARDASINKISELNVARARKCLDALKHFNVDTNKNWVANTPLAKQRVSRLNKVISVSGGRING